MNSIKSRQSIFKSLLAVALLGVAVVLTGCGGGGGGSSSSASVGAGSGSSGGSSGGGSSVSSKSVEVSWAAPSRRENGDSLHYSEIVSYEIRYKEASEPLYSSIIVQGGVPVASHVLELSGNGQFQISISAIDDQNVPGPFSDPVTINI